MKWEPLKPTNRTQNISGLVLLRLFMGSNLKTYYCPRRLELKENIHFKSLCLPTSFCTVAGIDESF
jgi:hypothetical protein